MKPFLSHRERQDALAEASRVIMAKAEAKGRDLTASELRKVKANATAFDNIKAQIEARAMVEDQEAAIRRMPRRVKASAKQARLSDTHGFHAFGDFVAAVKTAGTLGGQIDGRLKAAAASTFGNESSGTGGGFAIPPYFNEAIMAKAFGEDSLISRTDQQPISGNSLTSARDSSNDGEASWNCWGKKRFLATDGRAIKNSQA
jgi:HK97 family phage major capsid protein